MGLQKTSKIFGYQNRKETDAYDPGEQVNWVIKEDPEEDICVSRSIESYLENSINSMASSSSFSSDLVEDASSSASHSSPSTSLSSSPPSNGPLYELSELMIHLPMRRGLSKFYQGKSQSFTSLASVENLEDLAKKVTPYRRKIMSCKSYGGGLDGHNKSYCPKALISKKATRGSFLYSISKRV